MPDFGQLLNGGGGGGGNQGGGGSGYQGGGGSQGGGSQGSFNWQDFLNYRNQVNQAVTQQQATPWSQNQYNQWQQQQQQAYQDQLNQSSPFRMDGGTESLFNDRYRKATGRENIFIKSGEIGEWFNTLPGQIAGGIANLTGGNAQQAQQDWTFDPNKFDLTNGLQGQDVQQAVNFVASIPGMIPGGIFEGASKAYEAATGTPIQEHREAKDGGYEIADYTLDASQRAAAGIDAAIDLAGTFTGGAGRVVGGVGKGFAKAGAKKLMQGEVKDAAKYAKRLEKAESINKSLNDMNKSFAERAGLGPVAGFVNDSLNEGGEEFVQSYMDDIRNKNLDENSFDRAMTGAAWGAAGGAVMSGIGAGLNKAFQGKSDSAANSGATTLDPSIHPQSGSDSQFERDRARNQANQGGTIVASSAQRLAEQQREPNQLPASTSQFNTVINNNLDYTESMLGERAIHAMMQADDNGASQAKLAKKFGTTVENLQAIDSMPNEADRVNSYNMLIKAMNDSGQRVTFVAGRNPDTNEIGTADVDLVQVFPGEGVAMNRDAFMMFGADVDGDKSQVYMGPGARSLGYLTRSLLNPINGVSNVNEDYVSYLNKPRLAGVMFSNLKDYLESRNIKPDTKRISNLTIRYRKAATNGDIDEMMRVFDDTRAYIFQAASGDKNAGYIADKGVARMMLSLHQSATQMHQKFDDVVKKLTDDEQAQLEKMTRLVEQDDRFLRSGDSRGATHFADFAAMFGYKIYFNTGISIGNPILRQSGQVYYHSKEDQKLWFGDLDGKKINDVYSQMIAFSFSLGEIGGDVESSIEGLFRTSVQDQVIGRLSRMGITKIDVKANWDTFVDVFVEAYNEAVTRFNSVLSDRDNTTRFNQDILSKAHKEHISRNSKREFARSFVQTFGSWHFEELLTLDKKHPMYGKTFNQGITEFASKPGRDIGPFRNYESFNDYWVNMLEDYGGTQRALGSRIEKHIQNTASQIRTMRLDDLLESKDVNGQIVYGIKEGYYDQLADVVDATNLLFGEDQSIHLSIATVENFINTEYGRQWFSGDVDKMMNVMLSVRLSYLYTHAIDARTAELDGWKDDVRRETSALANTSPLHMWIYYDAQQNDWNLDRLKWLTDLNVPYSDKVTLWESLQSENFASGTLISECVKSQDTTLGTSAITQHLEKSKNAMARAMRQSNEANLAVLDKVNNLAISDDQKIAAIKSFASQGYTSMSMDAVAAFVHSQRDIVKGMVDKGIAPTSSDIIYQMMELTSNGQLMSYLDELNLELGVMSVDNYQTNRAQILNILFDPEAEVRIYDPQQDGYVILTREKLFREINGHYDNPDANWYEWDELLTNCPALVSIITPQRIDIVADESGAKVAQNMAQTLDSAIVNYNNERNNAHGQLREDRLRIEASQIAFRDPDWWGCFLASMADIAESSSPAETARIAQETLRKHIDWFMTYASMDPNGDGYITKSFLWNMGTFENVLNSIEQFGNDVEVMDMVARTVGSVSEQATSSLIHGSLNLQFVTAVAAIAENEGLDTDTLWNSAVNNPDFDTVNLKQMLEDAGDDFRAITIAALNMLDMRDLNMGQYLNSLSGMTMVNSMLDNAADKDAADRVRERIRSWQDDGFMGFLKFLGYDTNNLGANSMPDNYPAVISDESINWSADEWIAACRNIAESLNLENDFTGAAQKTIRNAAESGDQEALMGIRRYYNQLIVTNAMNKFMFGTGHAYNPLAMKQEIEARRTMCKIGDKIRKQLGDRLEQSSRDLPYIDFYYKDPVVSYMSTSMVMNAQSGSIPSGINMDGATMKTVAAFGLLDDYECGVDPVFYSKDDVTWSSNRKWNFIDNDGKLKRITSQKIVNDINAGVYGDQVAIYPPSRCMCGACRTCSPASRSRGYSNVNFLARSISSLINWMQEPRHLKAKKSLGAAEMFANPIAANKNLNMPIPLARAIEGLDANEAADARMVIVEALRNRRWEIANFYNDNFDPKLHFDMEHAVAFANATSPIVEVLMNDGTVYTLSSAFLSNDGVYQQHYGDLAIDATQISSIRPVVMGLQEVAAKITRGVADRAYAASPDLKGIKAADTRAWAQEAMKDWDSYASKPLSIKKIMGGVAAHGASYSTPLRPDMKYTPVMKWNDQEIETMRYVFSPRKSTTSKLKIMSDRVWNHVSGMSKQFASAKDVNQREFFNNNVIVNFQDDGGIPTRIGAVFKNERLSEDEIGNETTHFDSDGNRMRLVEMYDGTNASSADAAYRRANKTGRSLIVRASVLDAMRSPSQFEKQSMTMAFSVDGINYVKIDPEYYSYLQSANREYMQMATVDFNPEEVNCAIASEHELGLSDAGHYTRKGYQAVKMYHGSSQVSTDRLLEGTNPVTLVTDPGEIANIKLKDIDFSYYDNNLKNKSIETYQKAAEDFINNFKSNKYQDMPRSFRNVNQDDCVGFVKTVTVGNEVRYAPLYYEGSVAHTASYVAVHDVKHGQVNIDFAADKVNYAGNESMKLDLYGVAYKSVGHEATDEIMERWAALDDRGFNIMTQADHMFDYHALSGRVFEMGDSILQNNLYFFTRKCGANLLFKQDQNGQWVPRSELSEQVTTEILVDLANGSEETWSKVGSGELSLFRSGQGSNDNINRIVQALCNESLLQGGFPHLFFNSARVVYNEQSGSWDFVGLERRRIDPRIVTKYMSTDDTLAYYNFLDNRLCPPDMQTDADPVGGKPYVFDRKGRMVNTNTISGKPERVIALVGPNYYTGEGSAISDLSRTASWSNQHLLKRLLDLGVYPRSIRDTIDSLATTVGDYRGALRADDIKERISDRRKKYKNMRTELNQDLYERVRVASNDPLYLSSIEKYRDTIVEMGNEFTDPIFIKKSQNDDTPALNDPKLKRDMDALVTSLNDALGSPNANEQFTLSEIVTLVRMITGYSSNDGTGITNITFSQFKNAIDEMKANLESHGHLVIGGKYKRGTRTETRIQIPLLPRGMNMRLMQMPVYQSKYSDINQLVEEQRQMLEEQTIPAIKQIENVPKRNALFRMADAVCFMNGIDTISGHVLDDVYMCDIVESVKRFGSKLSGMGNDVLARYDEAVRINDEYAAALEKSALARRSSVMDTGDGDYRIVFHGDDRTIATYILRSLASARRSMGLSYAMMFPANVIERGVNQTEQSIALKLGRAGLPIYRSTSDMHEDIRKQVVKDKNFRKLYIALRQAELVGADRELIYQIRNGVQLDQAIEATLKERGAFERFQEKFMNVMSGHDVLIEGQMRNFIDRFWQRSQEEAPWWHAKMPAETDVNGSTIDGLTLMEQRLAMDPTGWMMDVLNGRGDGKASDMLLARQCMNWAKRGDMAQRNLVSAIYSELATRSATLDFMMTAFVSPYFQYSTNRLGRLLNWIAPISSVHYLAVKFFTEGPGANMQLGRTGVTFGDLGLQDVQMQSSFREAFMIDMAHFGPGLVAMMLVGMTGALQPPEDDKKKGNFKEWTLFGLRVDEAWWIEDTLGLALPLATFFASAMDGMPRVDLLVNGLAYYLSSNPVTKVSDAVAVLFDPMAELYQEYDKDLQSYAKAMGGPPDPWSVFMGKATSFGLTFAAQFITPGIVREIYNNSQQWEKSYKRVYEMGATGELTQDGEEGKTQYTTYEDAIIRKATRNNPVMGFLADIILHPETGYMAHEMPRNVIYDPMQMNSIEALSLYEDPYTKKQPKSAEEQMAVGFQVLGILQSKSVDELYQEGFMIDYDTKKFVSQMIWDNIASLNNEWAELEQTGALDYYQAGDGDYSEGMRIVSEMKEAHYAQINGLKSLYYDKLWSDKLASAAQYNQRHTTYAQDVNGEWYATGYYPSWFMPVTIAPGETQEGYQFVMSPQNDWTTESVVTGGSTGKRGLVPIDTGYVSTPAIDSWSTDGTDTGHSELYKAITGTNSELVAAGSANGSDSGNRKSGSGSGSGYPRRSYGGGGGGGYRRGGGGGGYRRSYGSGAPNIYAPNVSAPTSAVNLPRVSLSKATPSRIMNTDRILEADEQYLRPDFETKGSREAYKRSDI